jgi:hypothetical protein
VSVSAGWFFWNIMARPLLGEEYTISPPGWLLAAALIAVQEEGESPAEAATSRSRLSSILLGWWSASLV